jgi:uncharacterized membrane protein
LHKKIVIGTLLIFITLSTVACSGNNSQDATPIKATWVTAQITGDTASIPASEVENNRLVHFKLATPGGDIAFMAYELEEKTHVRSNICPPCRSMGFSLEGDTLVCDTCATTFETMTGEGIEGACVDFPKAPVSYQLVDGNIVMAGGDLIAAHQNTLSPGLP